MKAISRNTRRVTANAFVYYPAISPDRVTLRSICNSLYNLATTFAVETPQSSEPPPPTAGKGASQGVSVYLTAWVVFPSHRVLFHQHHVATASVRPVHLAGFACAWLLTSGSCGCQPEVTISASQSECAWVDVFGKMSRTREEAVFRSCCSFKVSSQGKSRDALRRRSAQDFNGNPVKVYIFWKLKRRGIRQNVFRKYILPWGSH